MRVFNEKKLAVLGAFVRGGPMTPAEVAVRARIPPSGPMYTYLKRLAKWGLVSRGTRWRRGRMLYRLTEKGKARYEWLRRQRRFQSREAL